MAMRLCLCSLSVSLLSGELPEGKDFSAERKAQHEVDTQWVFFERLNEECSLCWWYWRMTWVGRVQVGRSLREGEGRKGRAIQASFISQNHHSGNSLHSLGKECEWGRTRKTGRSSHAPPCILISPVSDSYLYHFCLCLYNLSFAGMCLEMVLFSLILPETWLSIALCSPRSSRVPRRCLISYILRSYFFIDFHRVFCILGKPLKFIGRSLIWFSCSVDSIPFHHKSKSEFCFCSVVSFQDVLVNPSPACRSDLCLSHSWTSTSSLLELSTASFCRHVLFHRLLTFSELFFWLLD